MPVALEIVSPEKLLLSRPVDMVVVPAEEGDIGVLPGHAPMIVTLRGGFASLYEGGQVTTKLFIAGGFAEITPERCTVLADEVHPPSELSKAEGERRLAAAEAAWEAVDKMDVAARDAALAALRIARAIIAAAEAP
ncbi:MAG TPA: ATP synthase F1 subunit epsilon [Acetobacteraceae bacterium]|jgi:F-type H+-transporting ATPase subunit epsilon|nr:ATP synthase F1 subunit epsilon [Acetobacteraceae bacterium]